MKGNALPALAALTAVNTVGLLILYSAVLGRGAPQPDAPAPGDEAVRLAGLEERLARLEAASGPTAAPTAAPSAGPDAVDPRGPLPPGEASHPGPTPGAVADERPVTRAEVQSLVKEQLAQASRSPAAPAAPAPAARPKRSLPDVARELGLDAHQEASVDALLRQIERDSLKVLFEVDDVGLEALKGELAQAERDPRLKEQLRERLAVNWTRRSSEIGVLWVRMDARLRETLGPDLLPKFYGFDVQREGKEFPDIQQMFFAPPAAEGGGR